MKVSRQNPRYFVRQHHFFARRMRCTSRTSHRHSTPISSNLCERQLHSTSGCCRVPSQKVNTTFVDVTSMLRQRRTWMSCWRSHLSDDSAHRPKVRSISNVLTRLAHRMPPVFLWLRASFLRRAHYLCSLCPGEAMAKPAPTALTHLRMRPCLPLPCRFLHWLVLCHVQTGPEQLVAVKTTNEPWRNRQRRRGPCAMS